MKTETIITAITAALLFALVCGFLIICWALLSIFPISEKIPSAPGFILLSASVLTSAAYLKSKNSES